MRGRSEAGEAYDAGKRDRVAPVFRAKTLTMFASAVHSRAQSLPPRTGPPERLFLKPVH